MKTKIFTFNNIALELKALAKEKDDAKQKLAVVAKEKENARKKSVSTANKLAKTAKEKENVRKKLAVIAGELKSKATKLAVVAKEKEEVRKQLAVVAEEKEAVRKQLAVTAERLKLKDEQVVATSKEMEAFSSSVSHDLRAPLRAIDGFAEILVTDYADKLGDEGKRITSIIRTNTVQMGKLIDNLLSFSRLGRQEVKKNNVVMSTLVDEIYKQLKQSAQGGGRNIEFVRNELSDAKADLDMMRQVWINLISNAIKYTNKKEKAKIDVGSKLVDNSIVYYVKDNGAGFDMKYIDKLFGIFQRLHSVEEFEGAGIGLANVKRIIERHGGKVWAEAKVNEGATFYFTLPKV